MRRVALCRGVVEWEALCRVRADGVRVRWGAFCAPGCLHAWLSVYPDVDPVVWWSVALCLVAPWGGALGVVHWDGALEAV